MHFKKTFLLKIAFVNFCFIFYYSFCEFLVFFFHFPFYLFIHFSSYSIFFLNFFFFCFDCFFLINFSLFFFPSFLSPIWRLQNFRSISSDFLPPYIYIYIYIYIYKACWRVYRQKSSCDLILCAIDDIYLTNGIKALQHRRKEDYVEKTLFSRPVFELFTWHSYIILCGNFSYRLSLYHFKICSRMFHFPFIKILNFLLIFLSFIHLYVFYTYSLFISFVSKPKNR